MKKNIAVLMGGYSCEYPISLQSGAVVYKHIPKDIYTVYKVLITKEKWVVLDDCNKEYAINRHDFSAYINNNTIIFDFVFNVIHGSPCENGQLLAYFELLNLAHSSADFYTMALTFNKRDCLAVAQKYGVQTAKSYYLNKNDAYDLQKIVEQVGLPCFVKPNNGGSSLGMSKVFQKQDLPKAFAKAFQHDKDLLIESFLEGIEVSVGVIPYQNDIKVLPITEIVPENDFFDFQAKYQGKAKEITPARISPQQRENVIKTAQYLYKKLNMKGFSRSEFILVGDKPYFLEINSIPGMTEQSILPQQAQKAGIPLQALLCDVIESNLES